MEILYYAIISFCLKNCNHIDDMTKYVYYEPVSYIECLETVEKMAQVERELNPRLINRNINSLCVKKDILTDENRAKYTIWGRAV
jgi:hypothetical protein|tara:strand:+ start:107 stop:361 length:255 start_codon:yes stop_codon:yes gene_type:complete